MHRGVTSTLVANEILQCQCWAGKSWPADCSKAAVQWLQSSSRRTVCWSVEHNTCRCRPIVVAGARDELTVIDKICCCCIMKCLVDQGSQLEVDTLLDGKPVELPQHWSNIVT